MANRSGNEGYVTLAVLLIAGLLAVVVSGLLAVSRPALGLARIGGDQVAAQGLLQGGLATAAFLLLSADQPLGKVDGMVLRLNTGEIRLAVADEGGRIDVNAANPTLLEGLFRAVSGTSMSGQAFAARIVDWRDEDGDAAVGGAEAGDYAEAELGYAPPNLPFHSVEEVRFILGLTARDFDRLAPHITVFSGRAGIDPLTASETVLRAIPGFGRNDLRALMRARGSDESRELIAAALPVFAEYFLVEPTGVFRVKVEAGLTNGFSDTVESVIAAPQEGGSVDYRVVAWSRLASAGPQ